MFRRDKSAGVTFENGAVLLGALELALLPQLFADGSAGDVCLDAKAVALSLVEVGQLDHVGLGDVLFLEDNQDNQVAWAAWAA